MNRCDVFNNRKWTNTTHSPSKLIAQTTSLNGQIDLIQFVGCALLSTENGRCQISFNAYKAISYSHLLIENCKWSVCILKKPKFCCNWVKLNRWATDCRQTMRRDIDGCKQWNHKLNRIVKFVVKQSCRNPICSTGTYIVFLSIRSRIPTGRKFTYALFKNGSDTILLSNIVAKQAGLSGEATQSEISFISGLGSVHLFKQYTNILTTHESKGYLSPVM